LLEDEQTITVTSQRFTKMINEFPPNHDWWFQQDGATFHTAVISMATSSSQCTHLATLLSSITTATAGQKTIGSVTQSDFLMVGIKTPETC